MELSPYQKWKSYEIGNGADLDGMKGLFNLDVPVVGGFDTETTGLHIIKDRPFLIQFGWLIPKKDYGRVFVFYPTQENMKVFFQLAKKFKYFVGQNITYDLHMVTNIGYRAEVEAMTNLVDNLAVARLSLEAVPAREGGDNLKLKSLGEKYVHSEAGKSEHLIKQNLRELDAERIKFLTVALKQFPLEGEFTVTGRQKYWGKGAIEKFLKDPTNDVDDLPEGVSDIWVEWSKDFPESTYEDVDRELMIKYGGEDVITLLEFFKRAMKFISQRNQMKMLQFESEFILPVYRMERQGFKTDRKYLEESRSKLKSYITNLRNEMYELCNERVTVGQHERLKQIFNEMFGISLETADAQNMKRIAKREDVLPKAKRLAKIISSLRTAEKWYSTYVKRIINNAAYDGNVYTQINSTGAVSGRMSSDLQQFPRGALKDEEGNELFNPRRAFVVKGNDFKLTAYLDYSQIELRSQAHYTLLVSGGDLNLCRAYMPFRCTHYITGELFNFKTDEGRARWDERQENGKSAWLKEDGEPWNPTDLHTMTATKAYPDVPVNSDKFKNECRPKGKTTNFASNYGGGPKALVDSLDISYEEAEKLVNGYNEAFPGVIQYQKAIIKAHGQKGYVFNHYGRRYYLSNPWDAYKLANYVVQGSAADAIRDAMIKIDRYIIESNLKSRMVMPIHDEIVFDIHKDEEWVLAKFREIMIEAFHWSLIPVEAGIDTTSSNWAEAEEYRAT